MLTTWFRGPFTGRRAEKMGPPGPVVMWMAAYATCLGSVAVAIGAGWEVGHSTRVYSHHISAMRIAEFLAVTAPTLFLAIKLRSTLWALVTASAPLAVLCLRLVIQYFRMEFSQTRDYPMWVVKDLSAWGIWVVALALGLYVGRRIVHTYIPHPALEANWGRRPAEQANGEKAMHQPETGAGAAR